MLGNMRAWAGRHRLLAGSGALLALLLVFLLLKPKAPTFEYVTQTATRGDVERLVAASGKIRALNTVKVGAEVSGQITRVLVDYNSEVKAGQLLAEIDPTRLRARVQQAQAQVQLAAAAEQTALASISRAQADVELQTREYARRLALKKEGFVSGAALDSVTAQLAQAKASMKSAQAQLANARAQAAQAQAELSSSALDLRRTRITAPISGVVINKLVEPGNTVVASFQTPNLFEIAADITRMQVETSVDEADIGQVQVGQNVSFSVDSFPDEHFKGIVRQVRKAATENQNVVTYLVILDIDNSSGKLLPGMTANVEIVTGEKRNVLRVPTTALRFRPNRDDREKPADAKTTEDASAPRVEPTLVHKPGRTRQDAIPVAVTIGLQGESYTEVVGGDVKAGDAVIVRSRSIKKGGKTPPAPDEDEESSK